MKLFQDDFWGFIILPLQTSNSKIIEYGFADLFPKLNGEGSSPLEHV